MLRKPNELATLLVVSRDSAVLRPLWSMGEPNGWQLEIASDPWEAISRAQSTATIDLILLDLPQGHGDGLHSLHWLRKLRPELPIILIGHPEDNGRKAEGIRMGARDYFVRPIEDGQLELAIQRNLSVAEEGVETTIASEDVEPVSDESFFIGVSPIMRKLRAQAALLAEADVPVLIRGEDGSGKETAARLIHRLSVRSGFDFAKVNCAALPADLLERELFGSETKSASAPPRIKTGKLELCSRGTIFLDEITEMPASLQPRLLQVIQEKRFVRPGTSDFVESGVRIVAATSSNPDRAISENRLAEDLYHHLCAYTIHVPSLRDRKEELPLLSRHFMHRLARHYGLAPRELSPAIIGAWQAYNWPGNLRELESCVKRYLVLGDEDLAFGVGRSDSEGEALGAVATRTRNVKQMTSSAGQPRVSASGARSLRSLVQSVKAEAERNAIALALEKTGWNRKAAARLLKVSYRTVLYKIEQYQMNTSDPAGFWKTNGFRGKETRIR
jgi:two-component system, NtrC family, response regulator AtoC